ncbi:MAG: PIN domain-containing protein [Coleofasciculaceae cyanobacterium SM2_1_6]|nr:PIN domain-containing protein [Coleofasciculaceae cyanobacterium SM2_1_6]
MKNQNVILDTGALVALINRNDPNHNWAVGEWMQLKPPVWTCEAVISETCFLLKRKYLTEVVFEMIEAGAIAIAFNLQAESSNIRSLMGRYESVPMSFADACLVRMSEQILHSAVMTLDSDFQIYRQHRHQEIPLIKP